MQAPLPPVTYEHWLPQSRTIQTCRLLCGTSGLKACAWAVCRNTARSELTHSYVVERVLLDVKAGASALSVDCGVSGSVRVAAALELSGSTLEGLVDCVYADEAALQWSSFREQMLMCMVLATTLQTIGTAVTLSTNVALPKGTRNSVLPSPKLVFWHGRD